MNAMRVEEPTVLGGPIAHGVRYHGVDEMLHAARARIDRITPRAAYQEVLWDGALLVDIRPEAQRLAEGEVHEALDPIVLERNVLEWRLDPRSSARIPEAAYDRRVIVICQEGYTSSLAADALVSLGLPATDIVGGFVAWQAAGMPTACRR